MSSLLIIGAGGHGQVVKEVAEACGFDKISFLDDNSELAIGKIDQMSSFVNDFDYAFVGIGNNSVREKILNYLSMCGYKIATLVHPTSYISKTATVGKGVIVEPRAIVNTQSVIGNGSIISVGSIVDHDVTIGKCCHINSGAIVKAGATIPDQMKLEAGEVVLGYKEAVVHREKE